MPRPLFVALCIAIAVLAWDVVYCIWYFDPAFDVVIVSIDIAAIALLAFVHRRNAIVVDWAKSLTLAFAVVNIAMALLDIPRDVPETYHDIQAILEGAAMFALFFAMKLPSSRTYFLANSPPNKSLERTREG